ncbi:hypothetical protein C900_03453 [Fulvivirga imtechensis AK7]|uniref:Uncharacterized protein n=1 Tax=Fulvivirga imtechensis AK7 TaxID=1237149 RepID=L8JPB0_9BACT|nr:DUF5615 family PIN-like protein [Fulvivirga imtechensis]ELR70680.1 hypothetical protein C900_03453 [Fulvivirga imtechensis AK7]
MKLLLDENLPVRLKYRFSSEITVSTVSAEGWNSQKDAELLQLMQNNYFKIGILDNYFPREIHILATYGWV